MFEIGQKTGFTDGIKPMLYDSSFSTIQESLIELLARTESVNNRLQEKFFQLTGNYPLPPEPVDQIDKTEGLIPQTNIYVSNLLAEIARLEQITNLFLKV